MNLTHDDHRSTRELVNVLLSNPDEDDADSPFWQALGSLHHRGTTDVFDEARSLCESPCPLEQRIGCDILSQLGVTERPYAAASFPLVASVVDRTQDLDTLASALSALGWFGDLRGVDYLLRHLHHPDKHIRYRVALALSALDGDPRSIDGLIVLTTDASALVRDWATFGLGGSGEDSPAIRQALLARLDDPDKIVRGEALVGLAQRQDERVVEPLLKAFEANTYESAPIDYAGDALNELHDIGKYPQLLKWRQL